MRRMYDVYLLPSVGKLKDDNFVLTTKKITDAYWAM